VNCTPYYVYSTSTTVIPKPCHFTDCFTKLDKSKVRPIAILRQTPSGKKLITCHPAERRSAILNQILDPAAADRLGRIRLVKESRATDIENRLIMLAQTGQLRQKVTEEQLKDLLNAIAENQRKEEEEHKIVINRRKGGWDDDDDLLDL